MVKRFEEESHRNDSKKKSNNNSSHINDCYSSSERSNSPEIDLIDDNNSNDSKEYNNKTVENNGYKAEDINNGINCSNNRHNSKRKRHSISSETTSSTQSPKPLSLLSSAKSGTPLPSKPISVTDHSISQLLADSYSNNHKNIAHNKSKTNDNQNGPDQSRGNKGSSPTVAHNHNCESQQNLPSIPLGDKLFRPFQVMAPHIYTSNTTSNSYFQYKSQTIFY